MSIGMPNTGTPQYSMRWLVKPSHLLDRYSKHAFRRRAQECQSVFRDHYGWVNPVYGGRKKVMIMRWPPYVPRPCVFMVTQIVSCSDCSWSDENVQEGFNEVVPSNLNDLTILINQCCVVSASPLAIDDSDDHGQASR
jgi:hypothetical protein